MPTKPGLVKHTGAVLIGSQRDTRFLDTYRDQHIWTKGRYATEFAQGRPWCGWRELASERGADHGFVTAELQKGAYYGEADGTQNGDDRSRSLASAWDAPWSPESEFFNFDHRTKRIKLRYDICRAKYKFYYDQYFTAAAKISLQNGWGEIDYGVVPSYQITAVIDYPPLSPRIPEAAMAGDPWLLGYEEEPNPVLAKLLARSVVSEGIYAERPKIEAVATPSDVITATAEQLEAMVERAAERLILAREAKKAAKKNPSASAEAA